MKTTALSAFVQTGFLFHCQNYVNKTPRRTGREKFCEI
jgi:hypothetical protein